MMKKRVYMKARLWLALGLAMAGGLLGCPNESGLELSGNTNLGYLRLAVEGMDGGEAQGFLSPAFEAGITEYTVSLPEDAGTLSVSAGPEDGRARVNSRREASLSRTLNPGESWTAEFTVSAADWNAEPKTYRVTVSKEQAASFSNSLLAAVFVNVNGNLGEADMAEFTLRFGGQPLAEFGGTPGDYELEAPPWVSRFKLTGLAQGRGARVSSSVTSRNGFLDLTPGQSVDITLTVTAADGVTRSEYRFTVSVARQILSNDAGLASISLSAGAWSRVLENPPPGTTVVPGLAPPETGAVQVSAAAKHPMALITINGERYSGEGVNANTGSGATIIHLTVTAEDGSTAAYDVTVNKEPLPGAIDTDLESLEIAGADLNTDFNPSVYNYTINLNNAASVTLSPAAKRPADVSIAANGVPVPSGSPHTIAVAPGKNHVTLTLSPVSGASTQYSLIINNYPAAEAATVSLSTGTGTGQLYASWPKIAGASGYYVYYHTIDDRNSAPRLPNTVSQPTGERVAATINGTWGAINYVWVQAVAGEGANRLESPVFSAGNSIYFFHSPTDLAINCFKVEKPESWDGNGPIVVCYGDPKDKPTYFDYFYPDNKPDGNNKVKVILPLKGSLVFDDSISVAAIKTDTISLELILDSDTKLHYALGGIASCLSIDDNRHGITFNFDKDGWNEKAAVSLLSPVNQFTLMMRFFLDLEIGGNPNENCEFAILSGGDPASYFESTDQTVYIPMIQFFSEQANPGPHGQR